MTIDSFSSNLESKNNKENNQESKSEKQERLIIFWLKQKWITYRWLKLKIKELKQAEKNLKDFPEDEEMKQQVERLKKEINSKAVIIKVKENDNLRNLCKDYYGKWSVSTMILIPKLWYKEKIRIWENLPLPLKKYILPLIQKNIWEWNTKNVREWKGDMEIEWDLGDENVSSNPKTSETENNTSHQVSSEKLIWPQTSKQEEHKEIFWKITKKEVPTEHIKHNGQKEIEKTKLELLIQEKKQFLEKFLQVYAEYVQIHLDDTNFDNAKNHQDYIKLLQEKLLNTILNSEFKDKKELQKLIEDKLLWVFIKDNRWEASKLIWYMLNTNYELKTQINFLSETISNILFAKNNIELNKYEQESILKLRKLDTNDRDFSIFNLKEANLNNITYQKLFKEKQINFKENEYVKKHLERIENINLETINQIQQIYYQDPIIVWNERIYKEYLDWDGKININDKWLKAKNDMIKDILIQNWVVIKWALDYAIKLFDNLFLYNKTDYNKEYYDLIKKLEEEKKFNKVKKLKARFEDKFHNLKLEEFRKVYFDLQKENLVKEIKQNATNYLLDSQLSEQELEKYRKENKLFDLYCDINWIWDFEVSDRKENIVKFFAKELPEEVVILWTSAFGWEAILWFKIARLAHKIEKLKTAWKLLKAQELEQKLLKLKAVSYLTSWMWFHTWYRWMENVKEWKDFFEWFDNIKDWLKDMILIWVLKWVNDFKPLKNIKNPEFAEFQKKNIIELVESLWKDGEKHHQIMSKLLWLTVETWIVYEAGNGVNIMFGDKIQTEEDLLIAFGLVVWLRNFNKTALAFVNKDENGKISVIKIEKENGEILEYKKWEEIVNQRIVKLEEKHWPNLKWLTPAELNHQMKQLKVQIKHQMPDDLIWNKWRITNELLEKFKQEILKRQKQEVNPQTWTNVYWEITKLDWHVWEVLDIAKTAKTRLDFLKSMIDLFTKKWKLPNEKEVEKYIDIYIKAKVEVIENKPENIKMKKKVSEQAKKDLKEKMMKEYDVLSNKVNTIEKEYSKKHKVDIKNMSEIEKKKMIVDKLTSFLKEIKDDIRFKPIDKLVEAKLDSIKKEINKAPKK